MTSTIYTLGYVGRTPEAIKALAEQLDALVVDIRQSRGSLHWYWREANLRDVLGDRYLTCDALGNRNYKRGGPIVLNDPDAAVEQLRPLLARQPVILLCGCRDAAACHRTPAAAYLADRLGGTVEHLDA